MLKSYKADLKALADYDDCSDNVRRNIHDYVDPKYQQVYVNFQEDIYGGPFDCLDSFLNLMMDKFTAEGMYRKAEHQVLSFKCNFDNKFSTTDQWTTCERDDVKDEDVNEDLSNYDFKEYYSTMRVTQKSDIDWDDDDDWFNEKTTVQKTTASGSSDVNWDDDDDDDWFKESSTV